ncbi:MAG: ferredoxin [Bdellovibrio sp. CG12_big_fil_rev_8_21_14_0_65_39_13]|nr:MAG: ferredoxin [Bdellovibrio sp. CG22_combo_CG10-13_8_21_14_all_39_27]PIQ60896.1 MAG: ferredoxin [Bdellovibrio sp. CG12_big_fil_rev_8_21_14_0_65_39_13]PIR37091.1 MAG: ferredoxin [Bdellovibrio sp. CG11_big_fil_rev_8_21_14_0_20_39_38]
MLYLNINTKCISCDNCRLICPELAILKDNQKYIIDSQTCTLCGLCIQVCPTEAIEFQDLDIDSSIS